MRDEEIIVDIGCGEGILMEKIIQRLPDVKVFGVDPSPENVSICKKHGLEVYAGSVYELPLDDYSVDCVLFIEVIEHLDYAGLAIKEIKRVLKKGGKLILLFPHDSVFKLARLLTLKFKEAFYDAGHMKQWTPKEMERLLDSMGLKIISKKNLPFYLWLISLHCLIVARKQ
jgi:ubiquinone/menaquinone biosynthesis C-methylase UbiE